ncbi:MAG: acyltransferase [Candidatus Omnitrophota bacterium]
MNHLRYFYFKGLLKSCGKRVYFDRNVQFFRFLKNISIGNNVVIKEGAKICTANKDAKICIGANTTIGYHTFIFASESITIGEDCLIAPFVYIVDSDHGISKTGKINEQPNTTAPVRIGDDVWVASGAKILKGVTIGKGAVIAANAVVTGDVPEYTIIGGIPAKVIGERR